MSSPWDNSLRYGKDFTVKRQSLFGVALWAVALLGALPASAASLRFEFSGDNRGIASSLGGLPGKGSYSGFLVLDASTAMPVSAGLPFVFNNMISDFEIVYSGLTIRRTGLGSIDRVEQLNPATANGRDNLVARQTRGMSTSLNLAGIEAGSVRFEFNFKDGQQVFEPNTDPLSEITGSSLFDISDFRGMRIEIGYARGGFGSGTILNTASFDELRAVGQATAPVPLPAGAVLMLTGLGGMLVLRRRRA